MHRRFLLSAIFCVWMLAANSWAAKAQSAITPEEARQAASQTGEPAEDRAPRWIDIPNAKMPTEKILAGGQPTPEHLEAAARVGYRTVINLRAPGEQTAWDEAEKAAELGLSYVALPISGRGDLSVEHARQLSELVTDPDALPAMVHCASGNRVGALFALKAFHLDGDDVETALRKGSEAGLTGMKEIVREILATADR